MHRFFFLIYFILSGHVFSADFIDLDIDNSKFNFSKYTKLQFPQCFDNLGISKDFFQPDLLGTFNEDLSSRNKKTLRKQGKSIRNYHSKLVKLRQEKDNESILRISREAMSFINGSSIFDKEFLIKYKPFSRGYDRFILNGVPLDFLSSQQFSALMISSIALESAKDQGLHNLSKEWTNTGLKISRWIFENRGCSQILSTAYDIPNIKIKRLRVNNLCSLLHNTESYFAENLLLDSLQKEDYKSAIAFASLSIIDQELTPISQSSYESSAFVRLNNLVRLAYSAKKEKSWCLAYKGNDRAISLAKEIGIEPLEAWLKARDFAANYYKPDEEDLWSTRYGSAGDKKIGIAIPIEQVPPVYPLGLLQRGIEGCVMLNFTVNKEGKTEDIKVEWTTEDGFSESAIESAKTYTYSIPKTGEETTKIFNYKTIVVFKIQDPNKSNDYVPAGCE